MKRAAARLRPALVAPLVLLAAGGLLSAYVQTNLVDQGYLDVGLSISGGNLVLRLEQDASFRITNGTDLTALTDSMTRWTNVGTSYATVTEGTRFNLASPIDAGAALTSTNGNRLYFAETDTGNILSTAIAVAFFWVGGSGQIQDCDIILNERLYTFSTATPANPNQLLGPSTYDLGEIATHEIGHCLGLDHSPVAGRFSATTGLQVSGFSTGDFGLQATLYPYGTRTIQGRSLSQDDMSGISFIYPDATLASTTGTLRGRVLDGGDFSPVKGAHVVAVAATAPDVPIAGAISGAEGGGPGGEFTLAGLPPASYYLRIEPLVGTTNPFDEENTHLVGFETAFPWEYYDGPTESGFDVATDRIALTVTAGHTHLGLDLLTNVAAADPNEPNDTRAAATPAACEGSYAGSIVPRGDLDYFAVSVGGATRLQLEINASRSGSPLDAILGVFDAAGTLMAYGDNVVGLDPIVFADLPGAGTWYVAVASYDDADFDGTGGLTVGGYTLTLRCGLPPVVTGVCPGRVMFAGAFPDGLVAVSDADGDLGFDGQSPFSTEVTGGEGWLATRRDGGVVVGAATGNVKTLSDDDLDYAADRSMDYASGLADARILVSRRRAGTEHLYVAERFGAADVRELVDTGGDPAPERNTLFTPAPSFIIAMAVDEGGTVYVFDGYYNDLGGILAYRDVDGDGVADLSSVFLDLAVEYAAIVGRAPGELFGANTAYERIDRILDRDGDGVADLIVPYAEGVPGLGVDLGMAFDERDVLYVATGGDRVLALPDDDGDLIADRQVPFTPLGSYHGIAFGPGPPGEVSGPGSGLPVVLEPAGSMLRISWEDLGPTVAAYNVYEGTLGSFASHAPLACHASGTPDGTGRRYLEVIPGAAGDAYYLVTASDACGEGSSGRRGDTRRRPAPATLCGPTP
jgi:hypothetical protein